MNVLVADDHPIMRVGIRQLIQGAWPEADVLEAATLDEACRVALSTPVDAVVLDMVMPDASGTEGVSRMLQTVPDVPILVLSFNAESAYAARLLKMGAFGYLPKDRAGDELVAALTRLFHGKRYVTASLAEHLVDALGGRDADLPVHEMLSTQEHRVMLYIAQGVSPAEMADRMDLSVKTIGTYRARILAKTAWKNNVELTKYCVQHGLTDHH